MQALQSTARAQAAVAPAAGARPAVAARPAARAAAFATQKHSVAGPAAIARAFGAARPAAARQQRRAAAGGVVARAGGDVLVVGSSGQTAARVVVNLLKAGFKVTAGAWPPGRRRAGRAGRARPSGRQLPVRRPCTGRPEHASHPPPFPPFLPGVDTDLEESQEVVKFAKQLELINKGEAGNLKVGWGAPLKRGRGRAETDALNSDDGTSGVRLRCCIQTARHMRGRPAGWPTPQPWPPPSLLPPALDRAATAGGVQPAGRRLDRGRAEARLARRAGGGRPGAPLHRAVLCCAVLACAGQACCQQQQGCAGALATIRLRARPPTTHPSSHRTPLPPHPHARRRAAASPTCASTTPWWRRCWRTRGASASWCWSRPRAAAAAASLAAAPAAAACRAWSARWWRAAWITSSCGPRPRTA